MTNENVQKPIVQWKDKKLLAGAMLVALSFIIGAYGKVLSIVKFYEPVALITGLSLWAFSWVLLFIGVFLVGWETINLIRQSIHRQVNKNVRESYQFTKELPKKGIRYTKNMHRKGMEKIKRIRKKF